MISWRIDTVRKHIWVDVVYPPYGPSNGESEENDNIDSSKSESLESNDVVEAAPHVFVDGKARPLKRGLAHMSGKTVSKETYDVIVGSYTGWYDNMVISQLAMRFDYGLIDLENEKVVEELNGLSAKMKSMGIG